VFLVHGDVTCLVANPDAADEPDAPYIQLRDFFEKMFDERELVIFYDIASGMKFPDPDMERRFREMVGDGADGPAGDPIAAAKAGLKAKRPLPREPEACFPLIEKVLREREGAAVIVQSAHFIANEGGPGGLVTPAERINIERIRNWSHSRTVRDNRNIVLLLTTQAAKVSSEIRNGDTEVRSVFIPKPDAVERRSFLKVLTTTGMTGDVFSLSRDYDAGTFANLTQGLSLRQIYEMFLQSRVAGSDMSIEYIRVKKREILNAEYGEVMEVVDAERGLEDIGGMEHIKRYFTLILDGIRRGEARLVPMGVTLMGPPGTGKTAVVEALAKEAGFNFVKTKNIRSMWVGESEARMELLKNGLRSLAPVVVMNDEADLAEAGRDSAKGDSGVSERLMKGWMELLSDPRIRGKIIVINCTNRPDRIDAALKRSGRSDERLLLPMPGMDERLAIFPVMFRRHGIPTDIGDFTDFARLSDGHSGADIEKIVLNSFRFASRQGLKKVDETSLTAAIKDFIPNASQAEIDLMTLMGLRESSSRELIPPNAAEIVAGIEERGLVPNGAEIIAELRARKII